MSKWSVPGPYGCTLTSSQQPGEDSIAVSITFPHILRNGVYPWTPAAISALLNSVITREEPSLCFLFCGMGTWDPLFTLGCIGKLAWSQTGQGVIIRERPVTTQYFKNNPKKRLRVEWNIATLVINYVSLDLSPVYTSNIAFYCENAQPIWCLCCWKEDPVAVGSISGKDTDSFVLLRLLDRHGPFHA